MITIIVIVVIIITIISIVSVVIIIMIIDIIIIAIISKIVGAACKRRPEPPIGGGAYCKYDDYYHRQYH